METKNKKPATAEELINKKIKRRNFISFAAFLGLGAAATGGWEMLYHSSEETPGITAGARKPLRKALNKTELFFRSFFSNDHHVKIYPKSMAAKEVRTNGDVGIDDNDFNPTNWKLEIVKNGGDVLKIGIDDIKALPKTEIVYSFKCVEGWDQIQYWGGLKFVDLINHYDLQDLAQKKYIGMETPNGEYYVGLDRESALHPQTILAYEMNAKPVPLENGAPLRLIIPVKYGIKNLKRIGKITFNDTRPRDYWAERGYDYYSGL